MLLQTPQSIELAMPELDINVIFDRELSDRKVQIVGELKQLLPENLTFFEDIRIPDSASTFHE